MIDLLCLGTATIDIYYQGSSLTHGETRFELAMGGKYFVDRFHEGLGGGGANVAIGTVSNGLKTGLWAKVGKNSFYDMIMKKLVESNIDTSYLDIENEYHNVSSILLNDKGEKTIINYRTPHQKIIEKESDLKKLQGMKALYMANLSKVSLTERIQILRVARKNGIITMANLNVTDCRRNTEQIMHFLDYVDIFIINSFEFADIAKVPVEVIDFHTNILKKYPVFRTDRMLVITDGKKGSYAYQNGKVYYQKAKKAKKVVDTTGAGDGYTAGFIASYLKETDVQKAMEAGSKYAVKILGRLGGN